MTYAAVSPWWKCSQAAGHPPNWLSSSQRHLSSKEGRGKCWKKERDYNLFSTCRCMQAISNSRCQSNVLFAINAYGERGKGGDMERRFGWLLLDCDCCTGQEALRMQHRKRGTSLIILEWTEISCKAEMLCLGQARAELWSANELGFCAAVLHYWHLCTAVWEHLLPHLLYKPFGNKLKENPERGIPWNFGFGGVMQISVNLYVFWCSFEP